MQSNPNKISSVCHLNKHGPVTPAIYSTAAIAWMIAWSISCIVIAIVEPITSMNAPLRTVQYITQQLVHTIAIVE